jgi:hypothetical protein
MPAPVFTVTNPSSATINSFSYGNVNAGSESSVNQLLFWNNFEGTQTLSDAVQCSLTTMTFNGLSTNDTVTNGQEIVTNTMFHEQCVSQGDADYTAIGGPTTAPISDGSSPGVIQGTIGGSAAVINTQVIAIINVTAGPAQFRIRISYLYS